MRQKPEPTYTPTVGHVRDVLTWALRHYATAKRRGLKVVCAFGGVDNHRAVAIIRDVLRGRQRESIVSRATFDAARKLSNVTGLADKAWYNQPGWAA